MQFCDEVDIRRLATLLEMWKLNKSTTWVNDCSQQVKCVRQHAKQVLNGMACE